ncbi:DinB family protein [Nocardioides marinquilinus]|uniref:DinB family protein n=1 Tax=Nocardioides marinquilinus TaxID=1210400 RepID=A0ABP9PHE1_9ACTN
MTRFTGADDLRGATFTGVSLRGARIAESDLGEVKIRGSEVGGMDVDAPWLGEGTFVVNGVDVVAFVEAELDRRFPGRSERQATSPEALRAAWAKVEAAWEAAIARAEAMPAGTVDVSIDGEWSFAQTLRHLVMATDMWLGGPVLGREEPFHPVGLPYVEPGGQIDLTVFSNTDPTWAEVLEARADRVALVRDLLADATEADLDVETRNPHNPDHPETTRSCVHTVLEESWEHLRFALRDLDAIEARDDAG